MGADHAKDAGTTPRIRPMTARDIEEVATLADRLIGRGYWPPARVREMLGRCRADGEPLAWVAEAAEGLVGFRFTLPPGRWSRGRGDGLTPERWPAPLSRAGYFQSCFIDEAWMGRGLGRRMGTRALEALRAVGAEVAVAHSWKESPLGSSLRYLGRLGFEPVAEYPAFWRDVDYVCQRDGRPCRCTAVEMVRDLRAGAS